MANQRSRAKRKQRRALVLDPDKLACLVAAFLATAVMAFCFVSGRTSAAQTLLRTALTFVASYCVTFVFVAFLQHTTANELGAATRRRASTTPVQSQESQENVPAQAEAGSEEVETSE